LLAAVKMARESSFPRGFSLPAVRPSGAVGAIEFCKIMGQFVTQCQLAGRRALMEPQVCISKVNGASQANCLRRKAIRQPGRPFDLQSVDAIQRREHQQHENATQLQMADIRERK
jgi:hypothetical protein